MGRPSGRWVSAGDVLLVTALLLAGLAVSFIASRPERGRLAVVRLDGRRVAALPLDTPISLDVEGPLGVTRVVVEEGQVRITDSPCPNKYCIHAGPASRAGEVILCVPNRVSVRVEGGGNGDVDGVVG